MKLNRSLALLFSCWISCSTLSAATAPISEQIRKRALADLDSIHNMFEVKYAPKEWKREFANWDLDASIQEAKNRVENLPYPTAKECQIVIRDFFNSTRDYHVGVRFFSTESATLPFLIKGAQSRYFVCYVDQEQTYINDFPFEEGDEILSFDGRPIHDVIVELRMREFGNNTLETDHALAEVALTQRRGEWGHVIPSGAVKITGLKRGASTPTSITLTWLYSPEKIRDFSKLGSSVGLRMEGGWEHPEPADLNSLLKNTQFFEKFMVYPMWEKSYVGSFNRVNKHGLGARQSFIPTLGRKIWKSPSDSEFDAYIFATPTGKRIGYIRLPHYMGDEEELEEFGLTMNLFQKRTDGLVIDQVNNPGGSVFYLYALASTLTDKPLYTPKHRIAMTQEEIYVAHHLLYHLDEAIDDETARIVLGDTIGGYPVTYQFVKLMREFCNFLVRQWNCGKIFSDPTYLFGFDEINPHPQYRYTKPILLLVNELDFSGGDFFPALLQDERRVTVMGVRTAGAGGYVLGTSYPNHTGIKAFIMTGSFAERKNLRPIENLGVTPDIKYELSVVDLQENYREYAAAIVKNIEAIAQ